MVLFPKLLALFSSLLSGEWYPLDKTGLWNWPVFVQILQDPDLILLVEFVHNLVTLSNGFQKSKFVTSGLSGGLERSWPPIDLLGEAGVRFERVKVDSESKEDPSDAAAEYKSEALENLMGIWNFDHWRSANFMGFWR